MEPGSEVLEAVYERSECSEVVLGWAIKDYPLPVAANGSHPG